MQWKGAIIFVFFVVVLPGLFALLVWGLWKLRKPGRPGHSEPTTITYPVMEMTRSQLLSLPAVGCVDINLCPIGTIFVVGSDTVGQVVHGKDVFPEQGGGSSHPPERGINIYRVVITGQPKPAEGSTAA
jgi:hypothetical protein